MISLPPPAPWSTAKLGVVISTLAAVIAVVLRTTASVPSPVIVLTVMVVAFAVSLHATARRSTPSGSADRRQTSASR